MPSGASVDLERIELLRQLGAMVGERLVPLVVESYIGELVPRLERIEGAILADEPVLARKLAHGLRGTSANVGASAMEALLGQLVSRLAAVDAGARLGARREPTDAVLAELRKAAEQTVVELRRAAELD